MKTSKLLEALGGHEWVRSIGARLDVAIGNSGVVALVLPANRSTCQATHAVVSRQDEQEGGGFLVRWFKVTSRTEAEVVGEFTSHRLSRIAAEIAEDVRVGQEQEAGEPEVVAAV